jgi:hypothetical protein
MKEYVVFICSSRCSMATLADELRAIRAAVNADDWDTRGKRVLAYFEMVCRRSAAIPNAPPYVSFAPANMGPDYLSRDAERVVKHFQERGCVVKWVEQAYDSDGDPLGIKHLVIDWGVGPNAQ